MPPESLVPMACHPQAPPPEIHVHYQGALALGKLLSAGNSPLYHIVAIRQPRTLTETMVPLLAPLLEARSAVTPSPMVEDLQLILADLSECYPEQYAFWPQRAQRLAAAHEVAEVLAHRHGKPLLFHRLLTFPDAIFDQNRSRLAPLDVDVAESPASGAAWPPADVTSKGIPHGTHWW